MKLMAFGLVAALAVAAPASAAIIVDQLVALDNGYAAQRFDPVFAEFDAAVIDDFSLSQATTLTSITARFNDTSVIEASSSWAVEIYSSTAAAGTNLVGDVASLTFAPANVSIINDDVTIALNTNLGAGTYWIGVVPRVNFSSGQTFVGVAGFGNAVQANPAGGFQQGAVLSLDSAMTFRLEGVAAGVPEPTSWALLIAGFGLTGTALRRQRRRGAAA